MKGMISRMLIVVACLVHFRCTQVPQEARGLALNPTRYLFKAGLTKTKSAIIRELDGLTFSNMMLAYIDGSYSPLDTAEIFTQPGNENDFYLFSFDELVGESYSFPGFEYFACFHIHLTIVDENTTMVEVKAIRPRILVGRELLPSLPHFAREYIFNTVEPSTIEEYEILMKIGNGLGTHMPAVKYPVSRD